MINLEIKVIDGAGNVVCRKEGVDEISLPVEREYKEGDCILFASSEEQIHLVCQVDDALGKAMIYLNTGSICYKIPFREKKICYSPKIFSGDIHLITIRTATKEEISTYRNLAVNPMDQHGDSNYYPHALANVETRGESVFEAKNAIDGVVENSSHGKWPYSSWGINMQADAKMKLEFGRKVITDKILLYTRADFPHDNWWTLATITFSDGTQLLCNMEKSSLPHIFEFEKKEIEWLELHNLIKSDDPSPFPALSQIEVYGIG